MKNHLISGIFSHSLSSQGMLRYFSSLTLPITKKTKEKNSKGWKIMFSEVDLTVLPRKRKKRFQFYSYGYVSTRPIVIIYSIEGIMKSFIVSIILSGPSPFRLTGVKLMMMKHANRNAAILSV